MQIKIKWRHIPAEHEGDETFPEFWTADILPEANGLRMEVIPAPMGYRIDIALAEKREPLFTRSFKGYYDRTTGQVLTPTLEDAQDHALVVASDYFQSLSNALRHRHHG